ncbi:hypothetical protein ABZ591_35035, partial [Micromonospora fulviviridis]|uniref:hypothetical protein n=1 Tax=Micromonospora fulviviridis TaxID=47860 RepID=UPI0033F19398
MKLDALPRAVHRDDHVIRRGYAVGFGQWFFFDALPPAIAFGRAARMSTDCTGYGVYEAAQQLRFCDHHEVDEMVLLLTGTSLDRKDEVELLKGRAEWWWSSAAVGAVVPPVEDPCASDEAT